MDKICSSYNELPKELKDMVLRDAAMLTVLVLPNAYFGKELAFPKGRFEVAMFHHPAVRSASEIDEQVLHSNSLIPKLFLRGILPTTMNYETSFEHSPICTNAAFLNAADAHAGVDKIFLIGKRITTFRFLTSKPYWSKPEGSLSNSQDFIQISGDATAPTILQWHESIRKPSAFEGGDRIEIKIDDQLNDDLDPPIKLPSGMVAKIAIERLRHNNSGPFHKKNEIVLNVAQNEPLVAVYVIGMS
jgi:hypothetical protein